MRDRYIESITDLVVAQYARAHERGAVARVPARFEVELLLTGLAGLSFRYYSEGRRAELVRAPARAAWPFWCARFTSKERLTTG